MNTTAPARTASGLAADLAAPGQSLALGRTGLALLQVQQADAGLIDWSVPDRTIAAITSRPIDAHPDRCGLFHGAPALAFVLQTAGQPRYANALAVLDQHVEAITRSRLDAAYDRIDHGRPPALREFDLISGLTGLGAYLLHRHGGGNLLHDVLSYLARLTEPLTHHRTQIPGWWTHHGPADQPSARWPGGHGNNGIAHGITGPLALLATTARRDITVPGQYDAIGRICAWLDSCQQHQGQVSWWPGVMTLSEHRQAVEHPGPQRPSWCYGTPGIVRAQQLAALALRDQHRQHLVEQALLSTLDDQAQLALLVDDSLCHGWAGFLHCAERVASDATADHHQQLVERLSQRVRPDQEQRHLADPPIDGLLEGTPGIQLTTTPGTTNWDACLLLTG